jgi:hypothetical protein
MRRQLIDRMTDTPAFAVVLFLSGLVVLPVLALGVLVSPFFLIGGPAAAGAGGLVFIVLSTGGAIGIVGWLRARWGARTPERHNIGLTLAFLAIGIATALAVGGIIAYFAITDARTWTDPKLIATAVFVFAHGVWIVGGIAWIERLMFSYAVRTGRIFDAIPVALLLVALGLVLAVLLVLATLA